MLKKEWTGLSARYILCFIIIQFCFVEYKYRAKRVQISHDICTRLIPPGRVKFKTLASQNFGKRNRWIINLLLDVLVCSIAVYFYSLFVFWLALRARQKYRTTRKNIQRYYTPKRLIRYIYPTLLRRVQISRETSTNITRYLYSSHSSRPREVQKALASQNFGKRNRWIINLLLDVLVCSIAVYFYSLFVFWLALRARQHTAQLVKIYSDTTHQNV